MGLIKLVYTCSKTNVQHKALTKESILELYKDVFEGIGLFEGKCSIQTDPTVSPVIHASRRVPLALRDRLKEELERMESLGIITKFTEPTAWVSSLVIIQKSDSDKLRVCLDPKDLNAAILRPHYPSRTLEEILPELVDAKFFTKLDAKSGYWTCELTHQSSLLTTFNTPFGRYRYLRLPFGLKSSQDEFKKKLDQSLEGLKGMVSIADDIIIYGKSRQEHDQRLHELLIRAKENGIKFNKDKLEVGVTEVKYFGHLLTDNGLKPDPDKIEAIQSMKLPIVKTELETFLGMVTYLSKFAPILSEATNPLRKLVTQHANELQWDQQQIDAFEKIKSIVTNSPVLVYYDQHKPITLQVDASKIGLGAVLMQEGKPIAYASKSLTQTEINYAQIEKEMYAIIFGSKKFHHYIYGRKVRVETDHKPLIPISKKPLHAAPPRIQRMLVQLQGYDVDLVYVPGKFIPVADTLSRNCSSDIYPEIMSSVTASVHTVVSNLPISDRRIQDIKLETTRDAQLQLLKWTILNGWPGTRKLCNPLILEYWNFREELSTVDDVILRRLPTVGSVTTGFIEIRRCPRESPVECSWAAIKLFKVFNFKNNYFCRYFRVSTDKKTVVLPYNRLCF